MQWKQGIVFYMMFYTSSLYNTTPIHCTPHPLHSPVMNTQRSCFVEGCLKYTLILRTQEVRVAQLRFQSLDFERNDVIYIYIYICTHTYIHICIHIYIYTHISLSLSLYIYIYIYIYVYTRLCVNIYIYIYVIKM